MNSSHGSDDRPAMLKILALAATSFLSSAMLKSPLLFAASIIAAFPAGDSSAPKMNYIDQFGRVSSTPPSSGTYTTVAFPAGDSSAPKMNYIDQFGRVSSTPPSSGTYTVVPVNNISSPAPKMDYIDQLGRVSSTPPSSGTYTAIPVANLNSALFPPIPSSTGTTSPSAEVCDCDSLVKSESPAAVALGSVTPAPEPSSIVSAFALTGFFVCIRRVHSGWLRRVRA